jgi:hypothetical protein
MVGVVTVVLVVGLGPAGCSADSTKPPTESSSTFSSGDESSWPSSARTPTQYEIEPGSSVTQNGRAISINSGAMGVIPSGSGLDGAATNIQNTMVSLDITSSGDGTVTGGQYIFSGDTFAVKSGKITFQTTTHSTKFASVGNITMQQVGKTTTETLKVTVNGIKP